MQQIPLELVQNIVDLQKDLIVLFYKNDPILINKAFKKFFATPSLQKYKEDFGSFVNNFVPHPSYFHADKITKDQHWFEAILELPKEERIVSMVTPNYEPHAFSVDIDMSVDTFVIVTFKDITQDLIKRIMIENSANIDQKSGAYAKRYFLQIAPSYEDAARFNEKIIATALINLDNIEVQDLTQETTKIKAIIRQDDMLIHWNDDAFLLLYLVDNEQNAKFMLNKLRKNLHHSVSSAIEQNKEGIKGVIKRVEALL
jgi:hypothetical protein